MHFAEIPSGFEYLDIIQSRLLALEGVRHSAPRTREIFAQRYALKSGEPLLVTTRLAEGGDGNEDFLFGDLETFCYSAVAGGIHLQLRRTLSLHTERQLVTVCGPRGAAWDPSYNTYCFSDDCAAQGGRLACQTDGVQKILDEFGLRLGHLTRIQQQAYFLTTGSR